MRQQEQKREENPWRKIVRAYWQSFYRKRGDYPKQAQLIKEIRQDESFTAAKATVRRMVIEHYPSLHREFQREAPSILHEPPDHEMWWRLHDFVTKTWKPMFQPGYAFKDRPWAQIIGLRKDIGRLVKVCQKTHGDEPCDLRDETIERLQQKVCRWVLKISDHVQRVQRERMAGVRRNEEPHWWEQEYGNWMVLGVLRSFLRVSHMMDREMTRSFRYHSERLQSRMGMFLPVQNSHRSAEQKVSR